MTLKGPIPERAQVFIGGYQAFKSKSKKHVWRFWVNPGKSHNLSVVVDNQIYFRTRFTHFPGESLSISLPQQIATR